LGVNSHRARRVRIIVVIGPTGKTGQRRKHSWVVEACLAVYSPP